MVPAERQSPHPNSAVIIFASDRAADHTYWIGVQQPKNGMAADLEAAPSKNKARAAHPLPSGGRDHVPGRCGRTAYFFGTTISAILYSTVCSIAQSFPN